MHRKCTDLVKLQQSFVELVLPKMVRCKDQPLSRCNVFCFCSE